jgi:adenylate cyclase
VSDEDAAGLAAELAAVLERRLGLGDDRHGGARQAISRVLHALEDAGLVTGRGGELSPQAAATLRQAGFDDVRREVVERELASLLRQRSVARIPTEALPTLVQAYVRAMSRIVSAEVPIVRDELRRLPAAERPARLEATLEGLHGMGAAGFQLFHRLGLHESLRVALAGDALEEATASPERTIAMVDLVGSTAYLREVGEPELEALVDGLFEATQNAVVGRPVQVVKYVGDGVFLSGTDTVAVAAVAVDLVARLQAALPLAARGGLAHGPVVERAGDLFGMAVNASHALAKAARPSRVLAGEAAARRLPSAARGRLREVELPHASLGVQRVASVRADL